MKGAENPATRIKEAAERRAIGARRLHAIDAVLAGLELTHDSTPVTEPPRSIDGGVSHKQACEITVADLRAVLPGGDGFCDTYGRGLQLALDTMTATSRDLDVACCALQQSEDNCDVVAQVIQRISAQLDSVAKICWRLAKDDRIIIDDVPRPGDEAAAE